MTPKEYQELAMRTQCPQQPVLKRIQEDGLDGDVALPLLHSLIGMMGELGELAACLEKHLWYGQKFDVVNFKEELGDMQWYAAEAMNALAFKFESILQSNIDKLKKRYPEKYTDELAAEENRDRVAERVIVQSASNKSREENQQLYQGLYTINAGFKVAKEIVHTYLNGKEKDLAYQRIDKAMQVAADAEITRRLNSGTPIEKEMKQEMRQQTGHGWSEPPIESEEGEA